MNRTSPPRSAQRVRSSAETPDPVADELHRYDDHLRDVRGLAAGTRRNHSRGILPRFGDTPDLAACDSSHDGNASAAGRRRHQRHRALAWPRESGNYTSVRRGRSGNEGAGAGTASRARDQASPLSGA